MSYNITQTSEFEKEVKFFSKKYPSFKDDLADLAKSLLENPLQGTPLGHHTYKIRFAIKSKGKGKSGGARLITYITVMKENILFVGVYDKSDQETITDKEITDRLKGLI